MRNRASGAGLAGFEGILQSLDSEKLHYAIAPMTMLISYPHANSTHPIGRSSNGLIAALEVGDVFQVLDDIPSRADFGPVLEQETGSGDRMHAAMELQFVAITHMRENRCLFERGPHTTTEAGNLRQLTFQTVISLRKYSQAPGVLHHETRADRPVDSPERSVSAVQLKWTCPSQRSR